VSLLKEFAVSKDQTFFEQIPLETVRKICQERNSRRQKQTNREDSNVSRDRESELSDAEEPTSQP
jgi:hypothetical protein